MTKLLTFDITNTIIRVMGSVGQQYANVAGIYGLRANASILDQSFKSAWKKQNAHYPNFGCQQGLSSYKWWTDLVINCFTEAGYSGNDKLPTIANHLYVHFSTCKGWEVFPTSVCTTLDEIKRKYPTMKFGVISNFDERLDNILQSLAIRHYFDFVLPSGLAKVAKPDVKIFHLALDIASVRPSEAIHVGDNVTNDYFGARGVGMTALLLCHAGQTVPKEALATLVCLMKTYLILKPSIDFGNSSVIDEDAFIHKAFHRLFGNISVFDEDVFAFKAFQELWQQLNV